MNSFCCWTVGQYLTLILWWVSHYHVVCRRQVKIMSAPPEGPSETPTPGWEPRLSLGSWVALSLVLGKESSSVSQAPSSRQDPVGERAVGRGTDRSSQQGCHCCCVNEGVVGSVTIGTLKRYGRGKSTSTAWRVTCRETSLALIIYYNCSFYSHL